MKEQLRKILQQTIANLQAQKLLPAELEIIVQIERTKDERNGDFSSNIALMLARAVNSNPRTLASLIVDSMPKSSLVNSALVAGPGFINFYVSAEAFHGIVKEALYRGHDFGRSSLGKEKKVNIEFVSANPTGPLHVGHGRSAAYGSALAALLDATGFVTHREYYVNDAGRQMDILATSIWLRYLEKNKAQVPFPSNGYKGGYVITMAKKLKETHGNSLVHGKEEVLKDVPPDEAHGVDGDKEAHIDGLIINTKRLLGQKAYKHILDFGLESILADIKEDLEIFKCNYQTWFSERSLQESNAIHRGIELLRKKGHLYERDGATWFSSIPFGDDKDRVLIRENGQATYFASDITYLLNKIERDFDEIIYIFGADHHGYIHRLKAAAQALEIDPNRLKILLIQFATLYEGKEKIQMSTRSGSFVTLRQLREDVGTDAARFFYLMRKSEQHMDFDLALAKSQTTDNPIYYVQYASARICSVFRQLSEKQLRFDKEMGLSSIGSLTSQHEKALFVSLCRYPETLESASLAYEPHQISSYLRSLSNELHSYYNAHQFIVKDEKLRNARLCLIAAVHQVLKNGLSILGVSAPQKM